MLEGKEVCLSSLQEPHEQPILAKPLPLTIVPRTTNVNTCFAFGLCSLAKAIFLEVFVSFLMVSQTHNDIDASFGRWSMKLHKEDFPTILLLI